MLPRYELSTVTPKGYLSLVIYVGMCNMKCFYCNWKEMLSMFPTTRNVVDVITRHIDYIDAITVSGGEPTLKPSILKKVLAFDNVKKFVYTNGTNIERALDFDRIFIDVKGYTPEQIHERTKAPMHVCEKLIDTYHRYKHDDKFVFRIPDDLADDIKIDFKNIEVYEVKQW